METSITTTRMILSRVLMTCASLAPPSSCACQFDEFFPPEPYPFPEDFLPPDERRIWQQKSAVDKLNIITPPASPFHQHSQDEEPEGGDQGGEGEGKERLWWEDVGGEAAQDQDPPPDADADEGDTEADGETPELARESAAGEREGEGGERVAEGGEGGEAKGGERGGEKAGSPTVLSQLRPRVFEDWSNKSLSFTGTDVLSMYVAKRVFRSLSPCHLTGGARLVV
jgi:hypothetical protein